MNLGVGGTKLAKLRVGHQNFGDTNEKNPGSAPISAKLRQNMKYKTLNEVS